MSLDADKRAREILSSWASLKGHDRCWWYPELIEPLAELYGLSLEGVVLTPPTRLLFEEGCARFRREQYGKNLELSKPEGRSAGECLSEWIDEQRGKDYSYHDTILQRLALVLDVEIPSRPNVSEDELKEGCFRFQLEQYR